MRDLRIRMANYHLSAKVIGRSNRNSVACVAYRSGTQLVCEQTGEVYDYRNKGVDYVELILPKGSPEWINAIHALIQKDRQSGVQKLINCVEASEKRHDAQIYREHEFSLPHELTDAQNIAWVREFIQEHYASRGMGALANFHMEKDSVTGEGRPHCHLLLFMRELEEEGFSRVKNRDWNKRSFLEETREVFADYQNQALKAHGIDKRVDHRSYEDRGIDLEPQPKRGRNVAEMEFRGHRTEKQRQFDAVKFRNHHRLMRNPEMIFDIVTKGQSTFVWEDVQKVLVRYFDDKEGFDKIESRLKVSKDLVCLREETEGSKGIYTSQSVVRQEVSLVRLAQTLGETQSHATRTSIRDAIIKDHNDQIKQAGYGGFSKDQVDAIHHMTGSEQLSCVVGYAGAGKTTALKVVKKIYEAHGYKVIGLAPTGRAARNLAEEGIDSQVLDKFLWNYHQGHNQLRAKTAVILDEAGMVDTHRFSQFLGAMENLGCKVITVGDGAQLQAVQAGPAFRIVTDYLKPSTLESVVRQKVEWQREASRLFGQQRTREALGLYQNHGAFTFVEEKLPLSSSELTKDFTDPHTRVDGSEGMVQTFLISRRIAGNMWFEILKDCGIRSGKSLTPDDWQKLNAHPDIGLQREWKERRDESLHLIQKDVSLYTPALEKYNVDPKLLKLEEAPAYKFDESQPQNVCDLRSHTKESLTQAWFAFRQDNPDKSSIILTYSNRDAESLNAVIRQALKEQGVLEKEEKTYRVISEERNDFDEIIEHKREKSFAVGDRILFTKNNKSLDVSNGTLGIVLALGRQAIKVRLDERGIDGAHREVSFAPNIYPYFDHGWATTTHKAQGVTVDQTFKLASFEENRNLAYVGMSRHRDNVHVFGSTFDFWREEKVIDRLSGSAEKLSSLDYMDADRLMERMKEDEKHLRTVVKDWSDASFYVGKRLWRSVRGALFNQDSQSFVSSTSPDMRREWSEQERAKDVLGLSDTVVGPENTREEAPLSQKNALSEEIKDKFPVSPDTSLDAASLQGEKTVERPVQGVHSKTRGKETLLEIQGDERQQGKRAAKEPSQETPLNHDHRFKERYLDADKVLAAANDRLETIVCELLGQPNRALSSPREYRFGQSGKVVYTRTGPKAGLWHDFSTGEGGNIFKLVEREVGGRFQDNVRYVADRIGYDGEETVWKRSSYQEKNHIITENQELNSEQTRKSLLRCD